jgi:hypothetical protein
MPRLVLPTEPVPPAGTEPGRLGYFFGTRAARKWQHYHHLKAAHEMEVEAARRAYEADMQATTERAQRINDDYEREREEAERVAREHTQHLISQAQRLRADGRRRLGRIEQTIQRDATILAVAALILSLAFVIIGFFPPASLLSA